MSRAFTREIDDAPPPPTPERSVSQAANLVTTRGAQLIEDRVVDIAAKLKRAKDPALIEALRRDQRYWETRRATMQIVTPPRSPLVVGFGVTVDIVRNGRAMRIWIVGEDEAEPSEGRLAWTSPLARTLEGAEAGEEVEFRSATRSEVVEIVALS